MTFTSYKARFLRGGIAAAVLVTLASAPQRADAVTVAYWDFEDGVDGQEFTPPELENGTGGSVDTVNGILMRGFDVAYGANYTSNTPSGSGLAMDLVVGSGDNITSDGYVTEGALHSWGPEQWTIETTVLLRDLSGWNTFIGRDGSSHAVPESDFYLANNGIDDQFRLNIATADGTRYIIDGAPEGGAQTDTWYALAARSDGVNLSLWLNDGYTGYQEIGSLPLTGATAADNALTASDLAWTFGRGWYNGAFVDHVNGAMDDIRFSDTALDASEFIAFEAQTTLTLVVDPVTGAAMLRNDTNSDLGFDYYTIESDAGSLSTTGWDSLSDQEMDAIGPGAGESWDEATGAISANLLVEQYLSGETVLAPGQSVEIGTPYTGSGEGDLLLRYAATGEGLRRSKVVYAATIDLPGDFNDDGAVDAADYVIARNALGSTTSPEIDHSGDGVVNQADINIWKANYGSTLAPAAGVPEPTAALLALVALGAASRRR